MNDTIERQKEGGARSGKLAIALAYPIDLLVSDQYDLRGRGKWRHCREHDSLVLDLDKNIFFWNSRGEHGSPIDWVMLHVNPGCTTKEAINYLYDLSKGEIVTRERDFEDKHEISPPAQQLVEKYHTALLNSKRGIQLWAERGVTMKEIERFKLGYKQNHWARGEALSIPYLDNGKCVTIRHRMQRGEPRYLPEKPNSGTHIFRRDLLDTKPERLYIIEGEIKAIVASRWGIEAIALPSINIGPVANDFRDIKEVIFIPDPMPTSPHNLKWVKRIKLITNLRIARIPMKIDDMLLRDKDAWKYVYKAIGEAK